MSGTIRDRHSDKGSFAAGTEKTGGCESPVIVAGIGVGTGGAKSLKQLLGKIPAGKGIACVLVLHSGPSKKILSIRQLGKLTSLEVVEATEGMPVLADRIHVMPSDKFLNITGGRLTLRKPVQCDGMWMPIDHFLCTLAHDFRRRSCGIVLSGAGSDGTLGLSEIKAFGGRTLVEKPGSAEFPEMPQTAIDAGVADAVLAAGVMAEAIAAAAAQAQEEIRRIPANSQETNVDLRDILNILRAKIGYDFSGYKPNTLVRRIRRRMALGKFASYADYAEFLKEHPEEVALLQKDLLIGVTEFFRQPQAWEILEEKIVATLVENTQPGSEIRAWVPGCSTGQEAYSLAMVLTEQVKKSGKKVGIQIFATDSDPAALATARSGSYSKNEIAENVSAERLKRFFERKEGRYQVLKQIREQVVFAPQNLTADPPFSRLDLISCRNLLMYLEQPVQQKIIVLFHFALRNGGFLFLGTAETTGDREDLFEPISKKWRIYRRIGIGRPAGIEIPVRPMGQAPSPAGTIPVAATVTRMTLASAAQQMLLDRFAPACVMIDRKLHVLYVHGKVEDYLTFPTGELTTRIVDMAREGLRARLRGAIGKCLEMKRPVSVIARVRRGEKSLPVKATVSPLRHPRETDGLLLVTFEDHLLPALKSGRKSARESDVQQLTDELKVTREELQSTIEQLESSNDQLKASNEEVTASNEELQSGNEELETSKEELQSLNEELNTINARLQEKVGELENTNNDVLNLLSSTAIATVFLDKELRVKRFTPASTRLLSLIPSDLGRPVADVLRRFSDETLLDDARSVLADLTPLAKEVQAEDGRWYFRRVTPYRTQDDRIEGVVLTFVDVSDIKQAEQALRASEKKYRDLVESANSVIIRWKPDGELTYFNRYGLSFFGYREEEILGRNVMVLVPGYDSSGHDLSDLAKSVVEHPEQYINNENENILSDGRRAWMSWTNRAILDEAGNIREILAIGNDITERKRAEEELRLAHLRVSWLARFPEENPNPVLRVSAGGEALYCNPAAAKLDGWKCEIGRPTPDPVLPLVRRAMAEGREVLQDVDLGERTYSVAVTSFPAEGYANVYGRDVTERKRAEEALQQSRERLDLALSSSGMATFEWDIVENKRTWSEGVHRLLGTKPETFTGAAEEFFQAIHPEDRGAVQAALAGAVESTGLYETEYRAVWPDGSIRFIAARGKIHRDGAGRAVSMTGVCWDITERKRAEEVLQTTLQRFYTVLSSMHSAILLVTDEGQVEFANQAFCDYFGLQDSPSDLRRLNAHEMIEKTRTAYLHPDEAIARIKEILDQKESVIGEEVGMRGGRTCLRNFIPLYVDGKSHGRLWHHWDITERKQAEEKLRRNEAMLRSVLDQMPSGVTVRDAQSGELILSSPRSREIMGALVDVPGQFTPRYRGLHPDGRPYRTEEWPIVRSMNTGEVVNAEEIECERSDGARIVLSMNSAPIRDPQGKIVMGVGVFHDVTERKRAEEELRESETKYRHLFENITEEVHFWKLVRDASGRITTWRLVDANPPTLKTWGKTLDEIKGKTTDEIFGPGASEHYMPVVRKIMEEGVPYSFEDYFPHLDKYFRFTSVPLGEHFITTGADITGLKKIEQSLRQSHEDLDRAQAVGQIGSWRLDVRRNVLTWSDENHRIFGVPEGTPMTYETFLGVVHPDDRQYVDTQWTAGLRGEPYDIEHRIVVDGQVKWVREKAYLEFDDKRNLLGGFGITQDITERKQAEAALRLSEEKFSSAFAMNPAAVVLTSLEEGVFREVNEAFQTIFGFSRDETIGHSTLELQLWPTSEDRARLVQELREKGAYRDREQTMRRKSGEHFTTLTSADIFTLGDERIILSTWLDITERKRAEVALQEARRRLEVIVDSIADGFYALDREWRFTRVNNAALRHMGKPREEILGRTLFDVFPSIRNSVVETEYARAMESGEPRHFENLSLVTGRMLEIHAYPGSDNLTVLFLDVTEKNRMVTALRESQEALQEANEHLEQRVRERTMELQNLTDQLEGSRHELRKLASELVMAEERERKRIAGVLHDDIAQTLAAVRMRLEMIQEIPADQKDVALTDAKELLVQSIQETRALMNDLGNPLLFDMGLKPACEALAGRLMERHPVRIHCDIRDTYKHLDPDMKTILYQVVRELLNNVVKHSQAQSAHVVIDMENEHYRVKVADDGVGFEPQRLGTPTVEGGFGLYSIRERLMAVDGSLQIESTPGTGTVVTAILPAALD